MGYDLTAETVFMAVRVDREVIYLTAMAIAADQYARDNRVIVGADENFALRCFPRERDVVMGRVPRAR